MSALRWNMSESGAWSQPSEPAPRSRNLSTNFETLVS